MLNLESNLSLKERRRRRLIFNMLMKKFCPNCGSEDIDMVTGGITGSWICRKCGYSGSIFPEKPIIMEGSAKISEKLTKTNKKSKK